MARARGCVARDLKIPMARSDIPVVASVGPLRWEFAALTDVGRVRLNNEDAVSVEPACGLTLLADGLGGYAGGEVASGMAIALLQARIGRWLTHAGSLAAVRAVQRTLQLGVEEANAAIFEAARANPQLQGMGTTLVLAVFGGRRAIVGHIGDSRCYRLRSGTLELLTRDHSMLQEQIDAGLMTPDEATRSPHRNLITRALGIERAVQLEMHEHTAQEGDVFLLCSDGLSELVSPEQLFTLLIQSDNLDQKAALLVTAANDNGGRDNISVVLAKANGSAASDVTP